MKVLLAVDGSPCSEAAVNEVATRPWPAGSQVKIVTAYELPPPSPTPYAWAVPAEYFDELEKAARTSAQTVLDAAEAGLAASLDQSVQVTKETLSGSPRSAITEEADRWQADLIVLGSHGYGAWHRFLLGSVSQAVVSRAKCSVEVVRVHEVAQQKLAA
jgi:nucleotide-binding universal stress UspA family protein